MNTFNCIDTMENSQLFYDCLFYGFTRNIKCKKITDNILGMNVWNLEG